MAESEVLYLQRCENTVGLKQINFKNKNMILLYYMYGT